MSVVTSRPCSPDGRRVVGLGHYLGGSESEPIRRGRLNDTSPPNRREPFGGASPPNGTPNRKRLLPAPRIAPYMLPVAPAAGIVDTLTNDPILVVLVVGLFLIVMAAYFYIRRTLSNLRDGYEDAYRGK
jgi:hypothetical protein